MENGVIILGDATANSLGVLRSLNLVNVPTVLVTSNTNNCAFYSKYAKKFVFPNPHQEPERYIQNLVDMATNYRNFVLMPTADTSVKLISQNKKFLEEYYKVPIPEWDILEKCVIKEKTYEIAKKLNIPTPDTYKLYDFNQLKEISEKINYPCIIKGSTEKERLHIPAKVLEISNKKELLEYGRFSLSIDVHPIIQEIIVGSPENLISLGSILDENSAPAAIFVVRKIRQIPFMFGVGTLTESTWNSTVVRQGLRFLGHVKYTGISQVEFKFDPRDRKYKLIEINPRSWLHIYLPTYCGLNFPHIVYRLANGEKVDLMDYRKGVKWHYLTSDFAVILKIVKKWDPFFDLDHFIKSFWGPRVLATLSLDDPGPFIKSVGNHIMGFVNTLK